MPSVKGISQWIDLCCHETSVAKKCQVIAYNVYTAYSFFAILFEIMDHESALFLQHIQKYNRQYDTM